MAADFKSDLNLESAILLVGMPLVGSGLGETDVCENSVNELTGHFCGALWQVIECGDDGEDDGSGIGCELHVA